MDVKKYNFKWKWNCNFSNWESFLKATLLSSTLFSLSPPPLSLSLIQTEKLDSILPWTCYMRWMNNARVRVWQSKIQNPSILSKNFLWIKTYCKRDHRWVFVLNLELRYRLKDKTRLNPSFIKESMRCQSGGHYKKQEREWKKVQPHPIRPS